MHSIDSIKTGFIRFLVFIFINDTIKKSDLTFALDRLGRTGIPTHNLPNL